MTSTLLRTPTASTFSISDLVEQVRGGRVRIPSFQRNYRWEVDDVLKLFDSVYRGYPIGSLLLWRSPAPYELISLGSLEIEAESTNEALWVVDGQQRVTSLAGVLLSLGEVEDPRFSIFFDLEQQRFGRGRKPLPQHWLPMNRVADTRALLRWLGELQRAGGVDQLVSAAEDLSKRVREYQVPAYVVETNDEATLRTIFDRLNTFGKALKSAEVFQALHGGRRGQAPEDLRTLSAEVSELGFGTFDDNSLLRAVLALRGPDVYRDFRNEFSEAEDPTDTFRDAARALEQMVGFLRSEAEIAHLRLLPYRYVIPVLARFFHLHREPNPRSLILLRRWLWRGALAAGKRSTSVSAFRESVRAIDSDENTSVQRLVRAVATGDADPGNLSARLNEARARANAALMGSWAPRSLVDGSPINLAAHFENEKAALSLITPERNWRASLANRMIHPPTASSLESLLLDSPLRHSDPVSFGEVLDSHGIPIESIDALKSGDRTGFLEHRRDGLKARLSATAARLGEWASTDRPPLKSLLVSDEEPG